MNEEQEKKPDLMKIQEEETPSTVSNSTMLRKRMLLIMGIVLGIILLLIIILFVVQLFTKGSYSYEKIEATMKDAAKEYYQVKKDLLPKEEGGKDSVSASVLSEEEYMKPLNEYVKEGVSCTGEVSVEKVSGNYVYTSYLDCGEAYQTKELYRAIIEQGVVTTGYGLYQLGNEYVYRGEIVNNYLTFAGVLWRIVKVNANNQVLLILSDQEDYMPSLEWDNRYNEAEKSKSGINTYHVSRIKEALDVYYKEKTDDTVSFSASDREKLAKFNLCVAPRSENYAINNNEAECRVVEENQVIGLLTVSDYLNASTDINCNMTTDKSCQNYNYLKMKESFWLATPDELNTKDVYFVSSSGYIRSQEASYSNSIRPVVLLNKTVMIASGDGTEENPFTLK